MPHQVPSSLHHSQSIAISIVSPVYRAANIVDALVSTTKSHLEALGEPFEIILVDDGSNDESWQIIVENCRKDSRVKGIKLSRNFGQHHAITAGLSYTRGEHIVVMDCDLQDDPRYIAALLQEARKGFDVVFTRKLKRVYPRLRNIGSYCFNTVFNWLAEGTNVSSKFDVGAYSIMSRRVAKEFCAIHDSRRHFLLVLRWLGFKSSFIEVEHSPRYAGESSYTLAKLIRHAIDGITSQSTRLLRLSVAIGISFCMLSALAIIFLTAMYFLHGFMEGWTSVFVLILFSTGIVLLSMGVLGIYIGNIFEQVKGRPLFLVDELLNFESPADLG